MTKQTKGKKDTKRWLFLALMMLFNLALSGCSDSDVPGEETIISVEGAPVQSTEEIESGGTETTVGGTEEAEIKKVEIDDSIAFPEELPTFGRLQWERWLEAIEEAHIEGPKEPTGQESDFAITVENQLELIGQPIDGENEEQLAAAKLLMRAVLRYAGVTHLNQTGAIDGTLSVRIYLTESTYDLDDLRGEVLLQMGSETSVPLKLEIVYEDSCRDQISDYRIFGYETSQPFYEVKEALMFESVITTTNNINWMYEAWYALKVPEELNEEVGKFMDSETDPTTGELIYPARDYDGDGETDRFFKHAKLGLYLMLSGGTVTTVDWQYTHLSDSRVVSYDLTGDGVVELIYLCRGRSMQKVGIWECVENEMRQIPIGSVYSEPETGVATVALPIIGERLNDQQIRLFLPDSKKAYVFASDNLVFETTYGYGVRELEVSCRKIAIENDAETGVAILRMSGSLYGACIIDLSWEMRYKDGKIVPDKVELEAWQTYVEADSTRIEPVEIQENAEVSDPIGEAEAAGVKLEKELWLELLEQELLRLDEDRLWTEELMETGIGSYGRIFCVPWSPAGTVAEKLTEVVQWDVLENGEEQSKWLEESNLVIHALVEATLTEGYWSTAGSSENEHPLAAAETLIGAGLKYAGERYVEEAFSGSTWKVKIQLLERDFNPGSMQGVLMIMQDGREPLTVEVRGQGEGTDAELTVNEINLPEEAGAQTAVLTVEVSIDTKSAMSWKYGVWEAFSHYEREDVCQIVYGELRAAEDCDGDGLPDRGFRYPKNEDYVEYYWVLGSGEIVHVIGGESSMSETIYADAYDLTGDGIKEIVCSKLRQADGNYLRIFEWTEGGLQVVPFCYASGEQEDSGEMYKIHVNVLLEKVDDTHVKVSEEECGKTIEMTVAPEFVKSHANDTPTDLRIVSEYVYFKESDSGYVLVARGYIGGRNWVHKAEIVWEMIYEDGVWKVIDIYTRE